MAPGKLQNEAVVPIREYPRAWLMQMTEALSRGHESESNSPKLASRPTHFDNTSEEDDDYRQERDNGEVGSEDSWDERQDIDMTGMLPESALADGNPEIGNQPEAADGLLPRDVQRKTAYYDYAAEKQMSHADAKLFYQRSQLEAQKTGGSNWGNSQNSPHGSPVIMPRSFSNVFESEQAGKRRSGSVTSVKSGAHKLVNSFK